MRVRDLIEKLKDEDQDAEVVLSRDEEGNGGSPLADMSTALFEPYEGNSAAGDLACLDDKDELSARAREVLVLWPLN